MRTGPAKPGVRAAGGPAAEKGDDLQSLLVVMVQTAGVIAGALLMRFWLKSRSRDGRTARGGDDPYKETRAAMVSGQIEAMGVTDQGVLDAMREVPRHEFVAPELEDSAYTDGPLPIGFGQTISQPFMVASMTEALGLKWGDKVLEIGTGSGYQAAVLAVITGHVFTMEIICALARGARRTLERLGYAPYVRIRCVDGCDGWPREAPFDAIILTAAPEEPPPALLAQLKEGGRLIMPEGQPPSQQLVLIRRTAQGYERTVLMTVSFVPMTGKIRRTRAGRV